MLNPYRRALDRVVNIDDLRRLAWRRVPRAIFDYIDGGADGEVTLRDNRRAWDDVFFRPRNAVRVSDVDTRTTVVGCDLACPLLLAPLGYGRLFHPDAEVGAARAAREAGAGYVLSTFSGCRVEDVAAVGGSVWYQLYLAGGRDVAETTLARAWSAGCKVLAVTIDTNAPGMRERDIRNGSAELVGERVLAKLPYLSQVLSRPRWLAGFLGDRPEVMFYPNVIIPGKGPLRASDVRTVLHRSVIAWEDLTWIRQVWPGPIVIKGVITGDDARRAVDAGADGLVVSNHGGRQLDTCYPTVRALPEVLGAVNGQVEVLVDGGIRRGSDIAKAISMGAKAVLIGRAYAYGLAAAGQPGVSRAISILKADLERTLVLLGCASTRDLDGSYVDVPQFWGRKG
jgi:isopentenyl diphosphate isomerase/L-lactate dehydrogenase-like FMN-dependent dehydrogenase